MASKEGVADVHVGSMSNFIIALCGLAGAKPIENDRWGHKKHITLIHVLSSTVQKTTTICLIPTNADDRHLTQGHEVVPYWKYTV